MKGQWYIISAVLLSFILLTYANMIRSNYYINYHQLSSFDIYPFLNIESALKKYASEVDCYYIREETKYFFNKIGEIFPTEQIHYNISNFSFYYLGRYRRLLTINYTGDANLTNYQIKLKLNLSQEYLQGKVKQYCEDVRFTWLNNSISCYDSKTLILTDKGWRYFSQLTGREKVLTLNPKTKQKEWQKIDKLFSYNYEGEMYEITLENGDKLLVSPEHKVYSLILNLSNILDLINLKTLSNSSSDSLDFLIISSLCSSISSQINSGATNSKISNMLLNLNNLKVIPSFINAENTTLALTTKSMLIHFFLSNFSYLFAKDLLTSFPNSNASSSVSFDFAIILSTSLNSSSFSSINLWKAICNNKGSTSKNSLKSSGTLNFIPTIKNCSKNINKNLSLLPITWAYSLLSQGKSLYFLTSDNKLIKIKSIRKIPYSGKIYDVDVKNDIILVKREGNSLAYWSGNSNENSKEVKIPYWIEECNLSKNATAIIWVKVPKIKSNSNITLYFYYGNPDAESESDGEAVFEFFDDFEGNEIDTSKWTPDSNLNYSMSNSKLTINIEKGLTAKMKFNIQNGYITETKVKVNELDTSYSGVFASPMSSKYTAEGNANSDATILYMTKNNSRKVSVWIGNGSSPGYIINGLDLGDNITIGKYEIRGVSVLEGNVKLWKNYHLIYGNTNISWNKNLTYLRIGFFDEYDNSTNIQSTTYDWVRVRKYSSQKPYLFSISEEQNNSKELCKIHFNILKYLNLRSRIEKYNFTISKI